MKHLLYNPVEKKFFKELNQGLTKNYEKAYLWSHDDFEKHKIYEHIKNREINRDGTIAIPMSTEGLQNKTVGFIFNLNRRDFWKAPNKGLTRNIKKAETYTLKEFKKMRSDCYLGDTSIFVPITSPQ